MKIVTLTTDFGTSDPYVGAMKGAILAAGVDVTLVDICHDLPPHDVVAGCLLLGDVWRNFPEGTYHLGVVDPGVGTDRKRIAVEVEGHCLIGPDNGLFGFAYDCNSPRFWEITAQFPSSATFEGRDVFAVAVARLLQGVPLSTLGRPLSAIERREILQPVSSKTKIVGEVVAVDRFGNLLTNIRRSDEPNPRKVRLPKGRAARMVRTYGEGMKKEPVALWNSFGRLEIAVRGESAADLLKVGRGTKIGVEK